MSWLERHVAAAERERQLGAVLDSLRPFCGRLECSDRVIEYLERPGDLFGDPVRPGTRIWPALQAARAAGLCTIEGSDADCTRVTIRLRCGERYAIRPLPA